MNRILHLVCSPRGLDSESARLSQAIVDAILADHPAASVTTRVLANDPLAHVDVEFALSQHGLEDVSQDGTAAVSAVLVRELKDADVVVIGTSVHNFTVPSAFKAWIDHVVRVRWTFDVSPHGKIGKLHDRPVFVAFSSGGLLTGEHARQPDFLTPYLKAVLAIIGLQDLTFFSVEGAAFGHDYLEESRRTAAAAVQAHFSKKTD
jgi:FMN-dependent NADH-azoreductase